MTRLVTQQALLLMAMLIGMAGSAAGQAQVNPLQVGDAVYVEVYRQDDMSASVTVDERGNITLPYLPYPGTVYVLGLTEEQAAQRVTHALTAILRKPQASIRRGGFTLRQESGRGLQMQTELIELRNTQAEQLSTALQGMTSQGGSISYDLGSNTLIITDEPATIQNIRTTIARLDELQSQRTQVQIETKVAEVQVGAFKELGVRWFVQGEEGGGGYYPLGPATVAGNALRGFGSDSNANENITSNRSGTSSNQSGGQVSRRFVGGDEFERRVNIPVHVPTMGQMMFGFFNGSVDVGVLLDAIMAEDKGELLANPSVLCINHRESEIRMVDEFPFTQFGTEVSGRSTEETQFLDLGIILRVTPHVYEDPGGPYVRLDLEPEVSFPVGTSRGVPIRSVRSYRGSSNVRDGQTLVVGGIYRNDNVNVEQKVPVLGNVPVVGRLFKRTEKNRAQRELIVMVTPRIHETPETVTWQRMMNMTSVNDPSYDAIVQDDTAPIKE